ncbi:helix-turn-helix domain-containing protein [Marmoricola sp. RAF53]|uniref:helix-turn-helix domain-containing protein n=1 Tax=Marmoricola sp. RAF53 TaxID=3233059 RepID=UPI003F98825A
MSRLLAEGTPAGSPRRPSPPPKQVQHRLPEERWDEIIAKYQAGASATSLAKKNGVDNETVRRRLRSRGITPRPQPEPTFTGKNLEEALTLRAQGWTYTQIGKHFGVNRQTAANALQKHGA